MTQAQPLALLCRRHHLPGFPGPHHMAQQGVAAVENMGDGVQLMGPQGDLRVHAHKIDMAPIVFTGPQIVELVVVKPRQPFPALGVFPNPVLERLLDKLLLALGDGGFFLVQNGLFLPVPVLNVIENPNVPQVQGFLNDLVGVDAGGAVGAAGFDIHPVGAFTLHIPAPGILRVVNVDFSPAINGRVQQVKDKLLYHVRGEPGGPQPHGNFAGGQIGGLHPFQGLHIGGIVLRVQFGASPCPFQLFPHVAGEVFIGCEVLSLCVAAITVHGVQEDHAGQVGVYLLFGLAGQLHHKGHIHLGLFSQ